MPAHTAPDVKRLLAHHGFMVYRTAGPSVLLAELVRDNLIMEAHVSVELEPSVRVRFLTRAQRSDFPSSSETESSLLERARRVGDRGVDLGFVEVGTRVEPIPDPMDPDNHLDTWYQVVFERGVEGEEELLRVVGEAIKLDKVAPR